MRLTEIAQLIGAELLGDGDIEIVGVNAFEHAEPDQITFVSDAKHASAAAESKAPAVIVSRKMDEIDKTQLVVKNVDAALITVMKAFAPKLKSPVAGIAASAIVDASAKIAPSASIGPHVVIGPGAKIGERTVLAAGCKIGENSVIGDDCRFDSNVVIYHNCTIGSNVIIQASATIGSTGFGYAYFEGKHNLIPHNGGVVIEDFVEIGASACIDRAKFGNTIIGAGTKIDNLVQIGHNVVLGKCCIIVSLVGVAGSAVLGNGVVIGGQVGIADHCKVGDGTMVAARSGIVQDVGPGLKLGGVPAMDIRDAIRVAMATQKLPDLVKQVKELAQKVAQLEASKNNTK